MLTIDIPDADFYSLDSSGKMAEKTGTLHHGNCLTLDFDGADYYSSDEFGRPKGLVRSVAFHNGLRIEVGEDARLLDLSSASVTKRTKIPAIRPECSVEDRVFSVATPDEDNVLQADQSDEAVIPEDAVKIDVTQKKSTSSHGTDQISEDDYASTLMEFFDFAWFDNNLFVRQEGVYQLVTPNLVAQLLGKVLLASERRQFSVSRRHGVSEHLALITAIDAPTLSIPQGKILLQNGMVDLRTMRLREVDPFLYFPCRICANWLRNPEPTPYWDRFLSDVSRGDLQIQTRVEEVVASMLFPGTPAKSFYVFANASNSGKSTLPSFLAELHGKKRVTYASVHDFSNAFVVGHTRDAVLNISPDESGDPLCNAAQAALKSLTGDDAYSYNEKRQPLVTRKVITKFVIATNEAFVGERYSQTLVNRQVIVPFQYEVPKEKQNYDLFAGLCEEADSIVSKLLPVAQQLWERKYTFSDCDAADRMTASWDGSRGGMNYFLQKSIKKSSGSRYPSDQLYDDYLQFCADNSFDHVSKKLLIQTTLAKFDAERYHSYERGIVGIAKKNRNA